jgi:hypothetical protein
VVAAALLLAQPTAAGTWAQQGVALPLNATSVLTGVSCTSPDTCMAVGFSTDANGVTTTVAENWNGSSWAVQDTANFASTQLNDLTGVSCASPTACMSVGFVTIANGNDDVLGEQFS